MTLFQDLHALGEEERIRLIGHYVLDHQLTVEVLLDNEPPKIDRYIAKLLSAFPSLVIAEAAGPIPSVVTLRIGVTATERAS